MQIIGALWEAKGKDASLFGTAIHNALENKQQGLPVDYDIFKTAVNNARNTLVKFGEYGEQVTEYRYQKALEKEQQKKNPKEVVRDVNYAYPSHPELARLIKVQDEDLPSELDNILDSFITLSTSLGFGGDAEYEALVTYVKYRMGGFVDKLEIIDRDKKIARVQDYKVNVDSTKRDSGKNKFLNELSHLEPTKLSGYAVQTNFYRFCLEKAGWTIEGIDIFVYDKGWEHYELELYDMDEFEKLIKKYLIV